MGPWSAAMAFTVQSNDMTFWVKKWFKVTETHNNYPTEDKDEDTVEQNPPVSYVGYLNIWSWDPDKNVLNVDRYEQDGTSGEWFSDSFTLNDITGDVLDFLCSSQIIDNKTSSTSAFTARINGSEKDRVLKATFNTLGGYYVDVKLQSNPPRYQSGILTITGSLISDSKVPVPSSVLLH